MMPGRCRFHIVGSEVSFQAVTSVGTELLGDDAQTLSHISWSAIAPADLARGDTVIGHIAGPNDVRLFREFAQRVQADGGPSPRIILVVEQLDMSLEIELLKLGALECLARPLNLRRFHYLLQSIWVRTKAMLKAESLQATAHAHDLSSRIARLSSVASNVLITGETGVGKSHLAKTLHARSPRSAQPFVAVNCAAIPEHLFESELFGHERGAFTGADRRHIGKLEFAAAGTVFLDDVDALPLTIQPKLLHAVENREFYPIGSNQAVKFQARLVSATNRQLETLVSQGSFRADLMYRLNTYELPITPLRLRTAEIPEFVAAFAQQFGDENQCPPPSVSPSAMELLMRFPWPGNLRELRNAIQFGAIDSVDGVVHDRNLPEKIRDYAESRSRGELGTNSPAAQFRDNPFVDDVRRLIHALARHNFNRTDAAAELGYSRTTLYYKLGKLKLN